MTAEDALSLVEKLKAYINERTKLFKDLLERDAELKELDKKIFELIEKAE